MSEDEIEDIRWRHSGRTPDARFLQELVEQQRLQKYQDRVSLENLADKYYQAQYHGPKACPYQGFKPCLEYGCVKFQTWDVYYQVDESKPWRGHCTRK